MDVLMLDSDYKFLERFEAKYENGQLFYKSGEKHVGFIKWGGETMELEFDYSKTVDEGRTRLAVYVWDGKNARQISFKETFANSTMVDYKNSWTLSKLIEETALQKPPDDRWLKFGIPFAAISIIVSAIVFIYVAQHTITTLGHAFNATPAYNISQQNAKILNYLVRNANITNARDAAMTQYIENVSLYVKTHG